MKIIIRADSGFCREELLRWCEDNGVDYVIGLARNTRLTAAIAAELGKSASEAERPAGGRFTELRYQTLKTWSRERRVVAKAEHLARGRPNPRFVVTSLSVEARGAAALRGGLLRPRRDGEPDQGSSCTCSPTGPVL